MHRTVKVETTLGPLTVAFTGKSAEGWHHCHVGTEASNVGPLLNYRGKEYYCSVHLYLKPSGWQEREEGHDAYITRQAPYKQVSKYDTPTIYKAIVEACAAAAERVQREQPHILVLAEADRLREAVVSASRKRDEARAAKNAAERELTAALDAEAEHLGSVGYKALDPEMRASRLT